MYFLYYYLWTQSSTFKPNKLNETPTRCTMSSLPQLKTDRSRLRLRLLLLPWRLRDRERLRELEPRSCRSFLSRLSKSSFSFFSDVSLSFSFFSRSLSKVFCLSLSSRSFSSRASLSGSSPRSFFCISNRQMLMLIDTTSK